MSTETDTPALSPADDLRRRILTGLGLTLVLGAWFSYFQGPYALGMISLLAAIMVTELLLMFAHKRYLYALIVAVLTAAGVWFSGRDAMSVSASLLMAVFIIGWFLAPPAWRTIFPVYVIVIAFGSLSVFWLRDTGMYYMFWPAMVAVAAGVGRYFCSRALGGSPVAPSVNTAITWPGAICGWIAAGIVGLLLSSVIEEPHSSVFYVVASIILAIAALGGELVESAVKKRAGVAWTSTILPGYGGVLDLFDGMIISYALVTISMEAGLI